MKTLLLWAFVILISTPKTYASFHCTYAQNVLDELEELDEREIEIQVINGINEINQVLENEHLNKQEKEVLKTQLRILNSLDRLTSKKSSLKKFYANLCQETESVLKVIFKGVSQTSTIINQSLLFPIKFSSRFFKGLMTGSEDTNELITFHEALGKKRTNALAFFVLFQGLKLSASVPFLAPFFITPLLDVMAMNLCEYKESLHPSDQKFCEKLIKIKNRFYHSAVRSQLWGARLHHRLRKDDEKTPQWKGELSDDNICDYLQNLRNSKNAEKRTDEFREIMQETLNPGHFSHPFKVPLETPQELMRKQSIGLRSQMRNVIISLAPKEKGEWDKYKKLTKELNQQRKIFGKLYRSRNVERCLEKKKNHAFNYDDYKKLKEEISSFKLESFQAQHELVKDQLKIAKKQNFIGN